MAHTNVQLVSGNLTTGGNDPTFYIDRVNNKVGIGEVPETSGDDSSNVLQVNGSMLATKYHGDGSSLTGIENSQWLHNISDSTKIYYNGGFVGIGVTDPGTALDVNGTITATSFTGIQASDVPTLNQDTTGNASSATNVRVDRYDTGDTAMYITMVSDGTESTSKRLYMDNGLVYDNTNNELKLSSIQIDDYIYHKGDTDTYFGFDAADHFRIVEGGGTRFQVDNTGNIGIGTTSPGAKLDVRGEVRGNRNTDTTSYFGRTAIGYCGHSDYCSIAHIDRNNTNDYALLQSSSGTTYLNCRSNQAIRFRSGNTDKIVMDGSGHFGINISSNMTAMLDIRGAFGSMLGGARRYFHYNTGITGNYGGWGTKSIYASGDIVTNGWMASHAGLTQASDRRIKTDIVDADDLECLDTLRQLQPKKYKYKDVVNKGETPVWGFIAQEVRDTLPYATNTTTDFIPNIYELGAVSSSNVITFTNFNTSNLHSNTSSIRIMDKEDTPRELTLVEIIDEHTIRVQEDSTEFATEDGEVFVYGEEVDDFVFLKKDAIFTVAVSALQEVDRQLQAEKARNDALEARILALENK